MKLNAHQLRLWSVKVRWRDRVCQLCGQRNKLQAHHLNSKSYFPEEAYDLDNGIALCGSGPACHSKFHNLLMQGTRKKCTKEDWQRFLLLVKWSKSFYPENLP